MICKHCGTEIADRALICYRCGTPTSVPERPAARPQRRPAGRLTIALALVALVLAALFLGFAGERPLAPEVSYGIAALAALILVLRIWQRRRR
jgi:hypothetical protein